MICENKRASASPLGRKTPRCHPACRTAPGRSQAGIRARRPAGSLRPHREAEGRAAPPVFSMSRLSVDGRMALFSLKCKSYYTRLHEKMQVNNRLKTARGGQGTARRIVIFRSTFCRTRLQYPESSPSRTRGRRGPRREPDRTRPDGRFPSGACRGRRCPCS